MTARPHEALSLPASTGLALAYRRWPASTTSGPRRGVLLVLHGPSQADGLEALVDALQLPRFDLLAWQLPPGPGRFTGLPAVVSGIAAAQGLQAQQIAVLAIGDAALPTAAWVHDHAPGLRGLLLLAPRFRGEAGMPLWRRHRASRRVVEDAAAIHVPTQVLVAGRGPRAQLAAARDFHRRLSSSHKELVVLPGAGVGDDCALWHAPAHRLALQRVRGFVEAVFAAAPRAVDLRQADRRGPLFDEASRLARPLPRLSPARLQWGLARAGIRLAACFSDGIRLGWQTGFDSGSTLDHVYRNQAEGRTAVGRAIDHLFLQSTVARSLRERRLSMLALLALAMEAVRRQGLPVRLIDIAAGPGRYLLDAAQRLQPMPDAILLCDHSALSVNAARGLIAERGLQHIARAVEADALSPDGLAALSAAPTVAVVSGLYEHVPDNTLVARSLAALHAAMPAGARLLYTNQPWQPQLELMARAMPSHRDGAPLRMRRRSQLEIDQLVQAAGFSKLAQRIDEDGLFSVSLAAR